MPSTRESLEYPVLRNARLFHDQSVRQSRVASRLDAKVSPHISPFSTLIVAMGTSWKPGCLPAISMMVKATYEAGYEVGFYEERDRCYQPYDALGTMRNVGYMKALEEGWEYVLYIDNDVRPPPDALARLLQRLVPVVSPIIIYSDGDAHHLDMPRMEPGKGLALVGSCVLSFLLFRTSVFLPWWDGSFWSNAIGDDEEYHFRKLAQSGHRPFVDTDVVVTCVEPPHYPLDAKHSSLWTPDLVH